MKPVLGLVLALLAAGCARDGADAPVLERVDFAPAELVIYGEGSLSSVTPASLMVPGSQWSQRQLRWALPDGSWVKADEVVARFAAEQSKLSLATAMIDLQRNALARAGKHDELGDAQGKLTVDIAQVIGELGIAHLYAGATELALSRDKIIDAVQDEHFLGVKQDTLNWRKDLSSTRGQAELALIDAQRATGDVLAKQSRDDLSALEVRAPHDGVVVLQADWSGEKPKIGAVMWAGNVFASLPDTERMNVEISIPQSEAQGIREGAAVDLSPLGTPDQKIRSTISWVAAAAATRSRETPVKYLAMKATVPAEAMARYHWVPGQRFRATIFLLQADKALTVPNIALTSSGDSATVMIRDGARSELRTVRLGVRGPSRTQVLDGLKPGETIVIGVAPAASATSSPTPAAAAAATKAPR
jgi:HlyD family secretion protein